MAPKDHRYRNLSIIKNKNYNIFYNITVDIAVMAIDNWKNSKFNGLNNIVETYLYLMVYADSVTDHPAQAQCD